MLGHAARRPDNNMRVGVGSLHQTETPVHGGWGAGRPPSNLNPVPCVGGRAPADLNPITGRRAHARNQTPLYPIRPMHETPETLDPNSLSHTYIVRTTR